MPPVSANGINSMVLLGVNIKGQGQPRLGRLSMQREAERFDSSHQSVSSEN